MIPAMMLTLALAGGPPALAAGLPALAGEPDQTQWKLANFTWVKRVPAEAGAEPSTHPAPLAEAALVEALGSVKLQSDGQEVPLFDPAELKGLTKALSEAFALARPGEDVVLLSTSRRGGGFMDPALGLTARLFVREGALNLLVHDARLDFMGRYSADRTLPDFTYGARKAASAVKLQAPGARTLRADWLALPLAAPATPATTPAAAPVPVSATQPTPPGLRDPAFYEAQIQKLRALKQLRDENLITEAEYKEKRGAILKTF
jgi:hypothetical protein